MNFSRLFTFIGLFIIYFFISKEYFEIEILFSLLGSIFFAITTNIWIFERQKITNLGKAFLESTKKEKEKN